MKAITANRLQDGRVVYLGADGGWTPDIGDAACYTEDAIEAALNAAQTDEAHVVGPYAIEMQGAVPAGAKLRRESIRLFGPTAGSTRAEAEQGADHVSI